ncbi:MAG: Re/Si-specific NAD(P)(+) transhydrogenase subunit alpha [Gemmatimonadetes bacterium]|nr:Re/Si-specific NAD(P)(+) transhydrogenase subunit alpha [Gemmatimonadota bacterium]
MKIAVMAESRPNERRVALVPGVMRFYGKRDFQLAMEAGAGVSASFPDAAFAEAGVTVTDGAALFDGAGIILKVQPPTVEEVAQLPQDAILVCHLNPLGPTDTIEALRDRGITSFAVELIPRITRAQKMDVLSSQATVAGYQAVLLGAGALTKFLPMLTTAAGTIRPGKALILGAGVAGLQAIATARRLGAVVSAFDVRPAVKEQVESLGASFLEMELDQGSEDEGGYAKALSEEQHQRELDLIASHIVDMDLVITTAQIPGRKAPILITRAMVESMQPGSVIVDLAGDTGGNCELTEAGETVVREGVTIMAPRNLPSQLPFHASQMYARNLYEFVNDLVGEDSQVDYEDEVVAASLVTRGGEIKNERVLANLAASA